MIGMGRPWVDGRIKKKVMNAYPRIISNLGQMGNNTDRARAYRKMVIFMNHYCITLQDRENIIEFFKIATVENFKKIPLNEKSLFEEKDGQHIPHLLNIMCDQKSVGYANTLGWAHPQSGDTMSTVMIGGLRTVLNGDFEVYTGDVLMWYWPFEKECFEANGRRFVCLI